jgi:protein-tyrosine phosphatase
VADAPEPMDPPLRVDWLDAADMRDDLRGKLGLTFLPGKRGPSFRYPGLVYRRRIDDDLLTLRDQGVTRLLLLVEDHELARWGDLDIQERGAAVGVHVDRRPIPDGTPPRTMREMDEILGSITDARRGGNVAVACMGGVGRTGTVAACALVAAGWEAATAIDRVREVRHPEAVETAEQERFVGAYERHVTASPGAAGIVGG